MSTIPSETVQPGMALDGKTRVNRLISADKVHGTEVYNHAGDRLGTVDSIMIDKYSGDVAHVVMSFGGFLGIGEKYHPLPWDVLDYDESLGGYLVDLDREALAVAPNYGREDIDGQGYDAADIDSYYADTPRGNRSYDDSDQSDAIAGRDRAPGYFSNEAQADRQAGVEGTTKASKDTDGPGFYSPEQQQTRNLGVTGAGRVVGPEGQMPASQYGDDHSGAGMDTRTDR